MGKARRLYERFGYVRYEVFGGCGEADNSVYNENRFKSSLVAPALLGRHDAWRPVHETNHGIIEKDVSSLSDCVLLSAL